MLAVRLVLDTNVVVSGALKPDGLERTILTFAVTAPAELYVSPAIPAEYRDVLSRPRLRIPVNERAALLKLLIDRSRAVNPSAAIDVCPDPSDNIFLECANEARVDFLVTGNKRHFPGYWKGTKIVNCRELMGILGPHLGP